MNIKTNEDKLVKISVIGEVSTPVFRGTYRISSDGQPRVLPGVGGITYNIRVGSPACGWEADHVEPGVSIKNKEEIKGAETAANRALNILSCVGNEAIVTSGEAKMSKGVVTGKHGGIEHVLVDFPQETLEKLVIGDKIQVKAYGTGMKLLDFPEVKVMNIDPGFLKKINLGETNGKLEVPVTHTVPAAIMGSGLGADQVYSGDYDIQLFDDKTRNEYGLDDLKLGDLVAIMDTDHSYGRVYMEGSVSVGIVVHSDCIISGHGPGVTTLFTSTSGLIEPRIDSDANIAGILGL